MSARRLLSALRQAASPLRTDTRSAEAPPGGGPAHVVRTPGGERSMAGHAGGRPADRTSVRRPGPGPADAAGAEAGLRPRLHAWAELLRVSALFSVPGDALAGAAAAGCRPNRGTALAVGTSLCLYEAGMALNDWSDREEDARERPGRPLPSGRITPSAALGAAVGFTGVGLGLAALAGRRAFVTATALAGTVWAYDLGLKHTPAAPATMATARTLDLLLGATATRTRQPGHALQAGGPHPSPGDLGAAPRPAPPPAGPAFGAPRTPPRSGGPGAKPPVSGWGGPGWGGPGENSAVPHPAAPAAPSGGAARAAALLGAHTLAVTTVSRHETTGGSSAAPLAGLATVAAIAAAVARPAETVRPRTVMATAAATALYAATAARPLTHAALNPSPPLLQRAVGGGIRAMIPLQAALAARAGAPRTAAAVLALLPVARLLSRKVSPT